MNEKLGSKIHSTQIDSVVILSNGDIAVSGGPLNYEIMIYRNKPTYFNGISKQQWFDIQHNSTNYQLVDSISTNGEQV